MLLNMKKNELKSAEEVIRALNHEVKNPLTALKGYAQLMSVKSNNSGKVEEYCEIIKRQVEKIESIFDNLYESFNIPQPLFSDVPVKNLISELLRDNEYLRTGNIDEDMHVSSDAVLLKKLIERLIKLNDAYDDALVSVSYGSDCICFEYKNIEFSLLNSDNYTIPYASSVYFSDGSGLYAAARIADVLGIELDFIKEKNIIMVKFKDV